MAVVNGGENLTTVHAVPKILSSGTLTQGTLLIDEPNHRIYFDANFPTSIVSKVGYPVFIASNSQFVDGVSVFNPGAGQTELTIYASRTSGLVGGLDVRRSDPAATIGMGFQNEEVGLWDLDLLGSFNAVPGNDGYDLGLSNSNIAANFRLTTGQNFIYLVGASGALTGVEKLRMGTTGVTLQPEMLLIQTPSALAAAGSTQGNAAAIVNAISLVSGADGTKGVALPSPVAGEQRRVLNNVSNKELKIYPAAGHSINSYPVNTPIIVASGEIEFTALSTTQWWAVRKVLA